MKTEQHDLAVVISVEGASLDTIVSQIFEEHKGVNIIIDAKERKLSSQEITSFTKCSNQYKEQQHKSVVLVNHLLTYDDVSETVSLVPTLQEAFDTVEMEEIERDLGF